MTEAHWAQSEYASITRLIAARTGLVFGQTRYQDAVRGIRRAMARKKIGNLEQYHETLELDAESLDDLVVELTVGETYFFREPEQYEFVRRVVMPNVCGRRGGEYVLRAWSAGCASGEEPFSLAILLDEHGILHQSHILATDISRAALAKAHKAEYTEWSLRGPGADRARPYLVERGPTYALVPRIQNRVVFERLNLALDVYPSVVSGTRDFDLIMCRNVLIYFDRQTVQDVGRRLFASLAPGGWLIAGASDPPLSGAAPYEVVTTEWGVFYQRKPLESSSPRFVRPAATIPGGSSDSSADRTVTQRPLEIAVSSASPRAGATMEASRKVLARSVQSKAPVSFKAATGEPPVDAEAALQRGEYWRAAELTRDHLTDRKAAAIHIQSLANVDLGAAESACAQAVRQHSLSPELHYLHAMLLVSLDRDTDATQAIRRVLYLDGTLAIGHFVLGSILLRSGNVQAARRAFENVLRLTAARPSDEVVPLSDGETAGQLARAVQTQIERLNSARSVGCDSAPQTLVACS